MAARPLEEDNQHPCRLERDLDAKVFFDQCQGEIDPGADSSRGPYVSILDPVADVMRPIQTNRFPPLKLHISGHGIDSIDTKRSAIQWFVLRSERSNPQIRRATIKADRVRDVKKKRPVLDNAHEIIQSILMALQRGSDTRKVSVRNISEILSITWDCAVQEVRYINKAIFITLTQLWKVIYEVKMTGSSLPQKLVDGHQQ